MKTGIMTDWKILAIKNSWSYLLLNSEEAGAVFYEKLFALDPTLKPLFKHAIPEQSKKLVDMLTVMVGNLQSMDNIADDMNQLAARHVHYGAQPEHYVAVGEALLHTLETQLDDRWNPDLLQAWQELYAIWSKAMLSGER